MLNKHGVTSQGPDRLFLWCIFNLFYVVVFILVGKTKVVGQVFDTVFENFVGLRFISGGVGYFMKWGVLGCAEDNYVSGKVP